LSKEAGLRTTSRGCRKEGKTRSVEEDRPKLKERRGRRETERRKKKKKRATKQRN